MALLHPFDPPVDPTVDPPVDPTIDPPVDPTIVVASHRCQGEVGGDGEQLH